MFVTAVFDATSEKCTKKKCSVCSCNVKRRWHRHPESWCQNVRSFIEQETGLSVGNRELCVCVVLAMLGLDKHWRQGTTVSHTSSDGSRVREYCVPSCSSADIEVYRHDFSWGDLCNSIGRASVTSPVDHLLCSKHYQQVYRMLNVVSKVKRRDEHTATSSINYVTCLIQNKLSRISRVP